MVRSDLPARDLHAEKSLLGSLMIAPDVFHSVALIVRSEHFFLAAHARIFDSITRLTAAGVQFDAVTLAADLRKSTDPNSGQDGLAEIGGEAYLIEVLESVPHAAHAEYYAGIVAEKWQLRELTYVGNEIAVAAMAPEADPEELSRHVAETLDRVNDKKASTVRRVQSGIDRFMVAYDSGESAGLLTGFDTLDDMLTGLKPGSLNILAARPSMGKTAWAGKVTLNVARRSGIAGGGGVGFFSLEQSEQEIAGRFIGMTSRLDSHKIQTRTLDEAERGRMVDGACEVGNLPIWVDDKSPQTYTDIGNKARVLKLRYGLSLIVVDYLQLIDSPNKRDTREQVVSSSCRALKSLAKSLQVPVLCLAQLNRAVEMRANKRPILANLRESGAIEQDADTVTFLHRPGFYDADERQDTAELIVAKHRGGRTGIVTIKWVAECMVYESQSGTNAGLDLPEFSSSFGEVFGEPTEGDY